MTRYPVTAVRAFEDAGNFDKALVIAWIVVLTVGQV